MITLGSMQTIGERIARLRLEQGLEPRDLAEAAGISVHAIYQIESGTTRNPRPENLFRIADRLGVDPRQLVFGTVVKSATPHGKAGDTSRFLRVPLIPWADAPKWCAGTLTQPTVLRLVSMAISDETELGERIFALEMQGDTMAPTVPPGATLILDPDLEPTPGRIVLVQRDAGLQVRQLVADGSHRWLRAINPAFPSTELAAGDAILATARAVQVPL